MINRATRNSQAKEQEEIVPSNDKALRALAKLSGTTLNPEATTIVDRLKASNQEQDIDGGNSDEEIAAPAIAMVDSFNKPIELFTKAAFNVEDLDPSQYKDVFG